MGANAQVASPRKFGCIGRAPITADANIAGRFYGANAFYCNLDANGEVVRNPVGYTVVNNATTSSLQLTPRGSQFESDWLFNLNLDAQIRVPVDTFDGYLRVSVFNVLNRDAELDFNEFGTVGSGAPNPTYGLVTGTGINNGYQAPRSVRFQLGVAF